MFTNALFTQRKSISRATLSRLTLLVVLSILNACGNDSGVPKHAVGSSGNTRGIRNGQQVNTLPENDHLNRRVFASAVGGLKQYNVLRCTATLIGPQTVLTAASCVSSSPSNENPQGEAYDPQSLSFALGGQEFGITFISRHPAFLPAFSAHRFGGNDSQVLGGADLAILKLSSATYRAQYIDNFDLRSLQGSATIIGLGENELNVTGVKRFGTVYEPQLIPSNELLSFNSVTKRGTFGVRNAGLVKISSNPQLASIACGKDQGGGVFNETNISGVLSLIEDPSGPLNERCQRTENTYYTSVAAYRDWIQSTRNAMDGNITTSITIRTRAAVKVGQCFPITIWAQNESGTVSKGGAPFLRQQLTGFFTYKDSQCSESLNDLSIPLGSFKKVIYGRTLSLSTGTLRIYQSSPRIRHDDYSPIRGETVPVRVTN